MRRREFLGSIVVPAAASIPLGCAPVLRGDAHERVRGLALDPRTPEDVARDESAASVPRRASCRTR
jgi:hypothetical protein